MHQAQGLGGRHKQGIGLQDLGPLHFSRWAAIDLVGDQPPGGFRAQGIEDLVHGGALLGPGRIGEIHNNQQAVGLQGFFQGGSKRFHQGWGQVADEPHGVGEQ